MWIRKLRLRPFAKGNAVVTFPMRRQAGATPRNGQVWFIENGKITRIKSNPLAQKAADTLSEVSPFRSPLAEIG